MARDISNDQKKLYIDDQIRFADGLAERGHLALAIEEYQRLVARFPGDELVAEVWIQLASAYAESGDIENSKKTFLTFFEKFPESRVRHAAMLRLALVLDSSADPEDKSKGLAMLEKLKTTQAAPEGIREAAIFHVGRIHLKNGDKVAAEKEFRSIAGRPVSDPMHVFRAHAAMELARMLPFNEAKLLLSPMLESPEIDTETQKTLAWQLAERFFEEKDFPGAAELFARVTVMFPDTPIARNAAFRRIECLYNNGDYTLAISEADRALSSTYKQDSKVIERFLYIKAISLKQLKSFPQAINIFQSFLKMDSGEISPVAALAVPAYIECLIADGRVEDAEREVLLRALRKDLPDDSMRDIVLMLVNASGTNPKYIPLVESALKSLKPTTQAYDSLRLKKAALLLRKSDGEAAAKLYSEIAADGIEESRASALMGLASAQISLDNEVNALKTYQRIIKDFPGNPVVPDAMLRAAVILMRDPSAWEHAAEHLDAIVKKHPESQIANFAKFYQAFMMFEEKKYAQAVEAFDKLIDHSDAPEKLKLNALVYKIWSRLKGGEPEAALAALKPEVFEQAPPTFLLEFAESMMSNNLEIAQKALLQIVKTEKNASPQDFQKAHLLLAEARIAAGNPVDAMESLRTAIESNVDTKTTSLAQYLLGNLLFERGKKQEAVMLFEKCLDNPVDKNSSARARLGLAKILSTDPERLKTANRYAMSVFILADDEDICSEAMLLSIKISLDLGSKQEAAATWKEFAERFPEKAESPDNAEIKKQVSE
ncbi:MAG: tetratricopeptide repeat protein [Victivallales bacterium]|nr:tetratricopeptide repeat protein [Victivallales bacterium]